MALIGEEEKPMKLSASLFLAATFAAVAPIAAVVQAQTTTEYNTTITTAPVVPSVTTRTIITVPNPPPPVAPPLISSGTSTTTTTELAPPADEEGGQVLGTAVTGNTTIVFEAANDSDIHTNSLHTWDDFAQAHPAIARTLEYKPRLINDPGYLREHPALDGFLQAHPDIRVAMSEDPGNFNAIPPRPGE
jgi:hypothetical protein